MNGPGLPQVTEAVRIATNAADRAAAAERGAAELVGAADREAHRELTDLIEDHVAHLREDDDEATVSLTALTNAIRTASPTAAATIVAHIALAVSP